MLKKKKKKSVSIIKPLQDLVKNKIVHLYSYTDTQEKQPISTSVRNCICSSCLPDKSTSATLGEVTSRKKNSKSHELSKWSALGVSRKMLAARRAAGLHCEEAGAAPQ